MTRRAILATVAAALLLIAGGCASPGRIGGTIPSDARSSRPPLSSLRREWALESSLLAAPCDEPRVVGDPSIRRAAMGTGIMSWRVRCGAELYRCRGRLREESRRHGLFSLSEISVVDARCGVTQ